MELGHYSVIVGCLPPPKEMSVSTLINEIRAQTLERPGLGLDATTTRGHDLRLPTDPPICPEIQCHFTHF